MGSLPRPWGGCSVSDCLHCKKFHPYVKIKHLLVQLVLAAPSHCSSLWRETLFPLCSPPLKDARRYWEVPHSLLFSGEKGPNSFILSSQNKFYSPLMIFAALLWILYSLCLSWIVGLCQCHLWLEIQGQANVIPGLTLLWCVSYQFVRTSAPENRVRMSLVCQVASRKGLNAV